MKILLYVTFLFLSTALAGDLPRSASPTGAEVYLVCPLPGATVSSPLRVVFGLRNMGVAPAGMVFADSGHHHLLIDTELPNLDAPVPSDAQHRHFGKGQTETLLELTPGTHTLQLLLADALHIPHQPPVMSEKITITVK